MKRYVIERMIPGIGSKTAQEYREAAAVSNEALAKLAPKVQWVHSYFADDMTYCVYLANDPEDIRRHAELSGFPANKITEVRVVVDPATAEAA
jgi:ABC-type hemin transport system substrate-binding protein